MAGGADGLLLPLAHQCCRHLACIPQLAIEVHDGGYLLLAVVVHHVGGRQCGALVHAHVERCVGAQRESSAGLVEVVRRHAQVGQQPVDVLFAIIAHPLLHVAEVAAHKHQPLVVVVDVLLGILVLVEGVESSLWPQTAQYLVRVAATAVGDIYIDTIGLDVQPVDALLQQDRYVICGVGGYHFSCGGLLLRGGHQSL